MARSKQKKKPNNRILCFGLIIILIIYLINRLFFLRPILWLLAIFVIAIYLRKWFGLSGRNTIACMLFLFFLSIIFDGIVVTVFKRIPAYTYNVISSEEVNIYYSPGLRVWQCDKTSYKNLVVDQFYNKGYMCNANDIAAIDSNSFLNSVIENFDDYHNQFVKIYGKISKKNSQKSIEMRPYIEGEVKVNGYVEFSNSIVLKVFFENNESILDEYDVYDDIMILGLIKNMEGTTGNYIIYMDAAKVISENTVTDYSISVTPETKCSKNLLISNDNVELYSYCLSEIFVSNGDTTSELVDAFSANKVEVFDLYKKYIAKEDDEKGNRIYRLKNYSILVCANQKEVIMGKSKMKFGDVVCNE